jgi:hypothetical protein
VILNFKFSKIMNGELLSMQIINSLVTHLMAGFEYSRTDGYFDPMGNAGGPFARCVRLLAIF